MYKFISTLILSGVFLSASACTIYQSSDRKQFESDRASFQLSQLSLVNCSETSLQKQSEASRLVDVVNTNETSKKNDTSTFLWEYKINNVSLFESDNLRGVYCVYEKN